ncbi:MAG: hemolysin family protein [Acidimicrobiia bacterium]|nr:hemolysin family protein [Acidimicrobiia bacterium]
MSLTVGIPIIIFLLVANGFFVAVEFALVAADRSKLQGLAERGKWSARAAMSARKRLSFHLSGAQLGITVTSLILGFLIEDLIEPLVAPVLAPIPLLNGPTMSVIMALGLASAVQMIVGELIPKSVAISKPESVAMALAPMALIVHRAFSPLILVFNGAANWTVRKMGLEPQEELAELRSLEELEYLIHSSSESGAIGQDARDLLTRTIRFGDKTAADALTPRVHIEALPTNSTVADLIDKARASRYSQFPVYDGDLDDIRGTVEVASVFELDEDDRATRPVTQIARDPFVVPETRDLIDILDDFRNRPSPSPMAIVIDEHGGTAGILTLEDVLEEIVGEVDDEYDEPVSLTSGVEPGVYVLAGTLHVDEVREACGFEMPDGDYETIAGFVLDHLGRIPEAGDGFEFDGWQLQVSEMDKRRIASLRLIAPPEEAESDAEPDGATLSKEKADPGEGTGR